MKRHAYATRIDSSSTHTSTLRELWLTAWKLTPNFFFANLKANYCMLDSWLIGLLWILTWTKRATDAYSDLTVIKLERDNVWTESVTDCMWHGDGDGLFHEYESLQVIQMLFNLLPKLMLINIHKTSKAETGKFPFQPKAVLICFVYLFSVELLTIFFFNQIFIYYTTHI